MNPEHCLVSWHAALQYEYKTYTYYQAARRPGATSAMQMALLVSALEGLLEDCESLNQYSPSSSAAVERAQRVLEAVKSSF